MNRFVYWIKYSLSGKKNCGHCCLWCPYYEECCYEIRMADRGERHRFSDFYKVDKNDKIWWIDDLDSVGLFLFSFDKKTVFNLFSDYPDKLTKAQKELFDQENPYWASFFEDRNRK